MGAAIKVTDAELDQSGNRPRAQKGF